MKDCVVLKKMEDKKLDYWFNYKQQKILHCVDTLYYTIDFHNDWLFDSNVLKFIDYLDKIKTSSYKENKNIVLHDIDSMYQLDGGLSFAKIYYYCIQSTERYWIFIAKGKPGKNVPAVLVQLRSQFLWMHGEKKAVQISLSELQEKIFNKYNLYIKETKINRVDYAYHTNYIQAPKKFYNLDTLNKMQVSNFEQFKIIGKLQGEEDLKVDYVSFGHRESGNIFVRMYNKNQEVIEKSYKQFFLKYWQLEGLISRYDLFVLEKCFLKRSYAYINKARLEWLIENEIEKEKAIDYLIKYQNFEYGEIENWLNKIIPKIIIIFNFEFQCKRQFFSQLDFKGDNVTYDEEFKNILQVIRNKKLIHDYLTQYVLRFVDIKDKAKRKRDKKLIPFWDKLQKITLDSGMIDKDIKLLRIYQKDIDKELIKRQIVHKIATCSLYENSYNVVNFESDIISFLTNLNENDIRDYKDLKEKKAKLIIPKLTKLSSKNVEDKIIDINNYQIVSDGELIKIPASDIILIN